MTVASFNPERLSNADSRGRSHARRLPLQAYGVYEGSYNDLTKAIGELFDVLEPASICSEALKEVKDLEIEKAGACNLQFFLSLLQCQECELADHQSSVHFRLETFARVVCPAAASPLFACSVAHRPSFNARNLLFSVLPEWEDYKPAELEVPPRPQEMSVYLPAFDPPPFAPSSEFVAPELPEVPPLVPEWKVCQLTYLLRPRASVCMTRSTDTLNAIIDRAHVT